FFCGGFSEFSELSEFSEFSELSEGLGALLNSQLSILNSQLISSAILSAAPVWHAFRIEEGENNNN
ncbi:MAG: hypothetical protein IJ710_03630, partial [Prevotella sp.]|nr:hypothetical protein [Prevotella sp.]